MHGLADEASRIAARPRILLVAGIRHTIRAAMPLVWIRAGIFALDRIDRAAGESDKQGPHPRAARVHTVILRHDAAIEPCESGFGGLLAVFIANVLTLRESHRLYCIGHALKVRPSTTP
jgi:hypothetical protein